MKENETVFSFLEENHISLKSRRYLLKLQKDLQLKLSSKDLNNPITDFSFFIKYQYLYWWICDGEQFATENLDPSSEILAVRKHAKNDGRHEVRFYKPSLNS